MSLITYTLRRRSSLINFIVLGYIVMADHPQAHKQADLNWAASGIFPSLDQLNMMRLVKALYKHRWLPVEVDLVRRGRSCLNPDQHIISSVP